MSFSLVVYGVKYRLSPLLTLVQGNNLKLMYCRAYDFFIWGRGAGGGAHWDDLLHSIFRCSAIPNNGYFLQNKKSPSMILLRSYTIIYTFFGTFLKINLSTKGFKYNPTPAFCWFWICLKKFEKKTSLICINFDLVRVYQFTFAYSLNKDISFLSFFFSIPML